MDQAGNLLTVIFYRLMAELRDETHPIMKST